MKTNKPLTWLLAGGAALCMAVPAFAQQYRDDDRPPPPGQNDRHHDSGPEHGRDDRPGRDDGHYADRGPGPGDRGDQHQWQRGDRYDGPRYVVDDYRRYDLPPPPDDRHRWVRDRNGDFVLIAITTGIITDLLLNGGR